MSDEKVMEEPGDHDIPAGFRPVRTPGPFLEHVGPIYVAGSAEEGYRYAFRAEPYHANPRGVVHGGMLTTFVDQVFGGIVWHAAERQQCATISLGCEFMKPAQVGDWIEAEGEVTRKGMTLIFIRGRLLVDGEPILSASGVWKRLRVRQP
jgi:uncharacterized protein (TIGR00369 family)